MLEDNIMELKKQRGLEDHTWEYRIIENYGRNNIKSHELRPHRSKGKEFWDCK